MLRSGVKNTLLSVSKHIVLKLATHVGGGGCDDNIDR